MQADLYRRARDNIISVASIFNYLSVRRQVERLIQGVQAGEVENGIGPQSCVCRL